MSFQLRLQVIICSVIVLNSDGIVHVIKADDSDVANPLPFYHFN